MSQNDCEAALAEAQQERDRWKAMFSSVADRNEEVTGHLRVVTEDRDYIADKLSRLQQQVTQQAATISQLRDALEKAKQGLETAGMGARYIDQALAKVKYDPST